MYYCAYKKRLYYFFLFVKNIVLPLAKKMFKSSNNSLAEEFIFLNKIFNLESCILSYI